MTSSAEEVRPMHDAEEVAREVGRSFGLWLVEQDGLDAAAALIRARDAEVAEAVTAEDARLREGIVALIEEYQRFNEWELLHRRVVPSLQALLNPPTEGEHEATGHVYISTDADGVTSRTRCSCAQGGDHEWDAS